MTTCFTLLPKARLISNKADPLNNLICSSIIKLTIPNALFTTFTVPQQGFEHIMATYFGPGAKEAILFLDINMPMLTGWEVLDKISDMHPAVKDHLKIFMLSSSVASTDKQRADNDPRIAGYITKSLSQAKLRAIFSGDVFNHND